MSKVGEGLEACNISPVRSKMKLTTTPRRCTRKTSRREQGIDVHTSVSSTPVVHRSPRLQRSTQNSPKFSSTHFNSPSSSFPYSQDHPDVIWDFTSPKLSRGSKKKELKITVQELLENLNQCQTPQCNSQSAPYMKLLENLMSKSKKPDEPVKKLQNNKKELQKRGRKRVEELKKFINSIQRPQDNDCKPEMRLQDESEVKLKVDDGTVAESNTSFKNSFLEGGSTDDSSEELWGDMDNSFLVKATQELEKATVTSTNNPIGEIVSTIPATVVDGSIPKQTSSVIVTDTFTCEQHNDLLLQLSNIDWDGDDEWENGFLIEDEDFSLIPEDILSGQCIGKAEEKENVPKSRTQALHEKRIIPETLESINLGHCAHKQETILNSYKTDLSEVVQIASNAELFNSFDDDNFEDENLLCQPDVLSRIDEVESMLSQPKCTPEEIKKKKAEAIRRRKNKQTKKRS